MGDIGDYWREHKEYKRAVRNHWNECPTCAISFGGYGTKVAPGDTCRHCGWLSPGQRGSDRRNANRDLEFERVSNEIKAHRREEDKRRVLEARTCPHCKKVLGSKAGRLQHVASVHAAVKKTNSASPHWLVARTERFTGSYADSFAA